MIRARTVEVVHAPRRRPAPSTPCNGMPSDGYASHAGDQRRQGRVDRARGGQTVALTFKESASHIEARLGVVVVGTVTHDTTSKGYFWSIDLPMMSHAPRPARDADKAKAAIAHRVREWCEAAQLISVRNISNV